MMWTMRGALPAGGAFAALSGSGGDAARILKTFSDAGQHGADEILQRSVCGRLLVVRKSLNNHDLPIVAAAEQLGFRLEHLRPLRAHHIATVHPIPAPHQELHRRTVQFRLDRWNLVLARHDGARVLTRSSPFRLIA